MAEIRLELRRREETTRDGRPVYKETYLCMTLDGGFYERDFYVPRDERAEESQLARKTD